MTDAQKSIFIAIVIRVCTVLDYDRCYVVVHYAHVYLVRPKDGVGRRGRGKTVMSIFFYNESYPQRSAKKVTKLRDIERY